MQRPISNSLVSRSTSVVVTTDAVLAVCDCEEATLLSDAKSVGDTTVGVADDGTVASSASQSESRTMTTAESTITQVYLLYLLCSDQKQYICINGAPLTCDRL